MSMYQLYSVDREGERWFHGVTADLEEAKRAAVRRAADERYAYVKELGAGTVFYITWVDALKIEPYESEPCGPEEIARAMASPRWQSLITPEPGRTEATKTADRQPG